MSNFELMTDRDAITCFVLSAVSGRLLSAEDSAHYITHSAEFLLVNLRGSD
jgi:hypothetical protein